MRNIQAELDWHIDELIEQHDKRRSIGVKHERDDQILLALLFEDVRRNPWRYAKPEAA